MRGTFPKFLEEHEERILAYYNKFRDKDHKIERHNLDFYAWPQMNGSTNPFGIGAMVMTKHTVFALVDEYGTDSGDDCVLIMMGRIQHVPNFKIECKFNTRENHMKLDEVVV